MILADIVQDLYIKELRQYKPTKDVATEKVDLPTTFTPPPPPPKPEIEAADAQVQATEEDALEEEEWPPLYDPIDDPANYPSNWHLDLSKPEADDGSWYPKPIKAPEYHDH
ncbi:hypothetical protein HK104_011129 [Borealophlyctis nickersoniae]|nr:hypothetical protein HK104_011129 [Borealophlyctis nickersoniae]